jgi:hypothetical protein
LRIIRLIQPRPTKPYFRQAALAPALRLPRTIARFADHIQAVNSQLKPVFVEEIDETVLWLELLIESGILPQARRASRQQEANELFAISVASPPTAKGIPRHRSIRKSLNS